MDKKYCGAGCSNASYRMRHPEKRRPAVGPVQDHVAVVVRGHRPAGRLADSVAQIEGENASLRRELASLKARIADMERSVSTLHVTERRGVPTKDSPIAASVDVQRQLERERVQLAQAESIIAALRAELAAERQVAQTREDDQKATECKAAQLQTELSSTTQALTAARAELSRIRARREPARPEPTATENRCTTARSSRMPEPNPPEDAPFARLTLVAMATEESPESVASIPSRQPQRAAPRAPFPWEVPNPDKPDRWMPYWQTSGADIPWLEKEGRAALREIPTQIYNRGERLKAREMRDWIESSPIFVGELAEELAGRIVGTRRAERKSRQQKDQLSILGFAILSST